jgi:hypothetical protein
VHQATAVEVDRAAGAVALDPAGLAAEPDREPAVAQVVHEGGD